MFCYPTWLTVNYNHIKAVVYVCCDFSSLLLELKQQGLVVVSCTSIRRTLLVSVLFLQKALRQHGLLDVLIQYGI
jgi:hypothetical protein